jgi:cell division protein FtsW
MKSQEEYDQWILMFALVLTCFGLVMVYSASSVKALTLYGDGLYFLKKQARYAILGILAMTVAMKVDYLILKRYAGVVLLVGVNVSDLGLVTG